MATSHSLDVPATLEVALRTGVALTAWGRGHAVPIVTERHRDRPADRGYPWAASERQPHSLRAGVQ